jgi:hypothetical protein
MTRAADRALVSAAEESLPEYGGWSVSLADNTAPNTASNRK